MARSYSSSQKKARVLHRRAEKAREQKVNPLYQGLTIIDGMSQPRTMPKSYRNYAKEGYAGNDTVWKVVNFGITNGAAIQPVLYTAKEEASKPNGNRINKHPLLDKLARPNPEQSGVFYRKAVLGYFLIAGNSFQYAIRTAKSGPPDELWTLSPELVHPIPAPVRGIIGYKYDAWESGKDVIPTPNIGHMRTWNPNDEFFGMSAIEVIAVLIDTQKDGRTWNLSLLQNYLKPPGAWTTTAILAPNDRAKLEARVNEKMAGARNAGKAPVLDGALEFKSSAVPPSEMDWLESMKYNSTMIANVYNMPPELTGDGASTFNNKEMAEIFAYTEYIFPTLDELYDLWNMWLVPMYSDLCDSKGNPTAYLYYDKESVEVIQKMIQAQKDAKADRANKLWLSGLAMQSEAQEMAGLQVNKQGNVYRFGAILVPADQIMDYAEQSLSEPAAPPVPVAEPLPPPSTLPGQQPPTQPDSQEKPDATPTPAPAKQPAQPVGKQPDSDTNHEKSRQRRILRSTKALDLTTSEEKSAYAASIETARKRHEDEYEKQIAAYFEQERKAVVAAIKSSSSSSQYVLSGRAEGAINDQQDDLKDILMDLYQDVAVDFGSSVANQLGGKKGFISDFIKLFGNSQLKYLLTLAGQKIQQITGTTLAKIRLELADGVAQGESIPELAKRLDTLYLTQIIPNRSTNIVRTEVVASSNFGSHEAAVQSGLTLKKVWLATDDNRTRKTHSEADGQEVDMDKPFEVGGEQMMYPGDSSFGATADELCQCRCSIFYRRATAQDATSDTSDEEKRAKRDAYRKFMDGVLV